MLFALAFAVMAGVLGLALTGIYVHRANGEFDTTTADIVQRLRDDSR